MTAKFRSESIDLDVIELWTLDLINSASIAARDGKFLSADERQRADRFRFPEHRDRFIAARAGLRKILARYLRVEPGEIAFQYSKYGKPELAVPQSDICFTASRSQDRALIACTRAREIGVDIEWIRRDLDVDDLAQRFFTGPEIEKIHSFPPELRYLAFFRCWTCKEAFVKAGGKGLSVDLKEFDVSAALADPAAAPSDQNAMFRLNDYCLTAFPANAGYVSALAVRAGEMRLVIKALSLDKTPNVSF